MISGMQFSYIEQWLRNRNEYQDRVHIMLYKVLNFGVMVGLVTKMIGIENRFYQSPIWHISHISVFPNFWYFDVFSRILTLQKVYLKDQHLL